MPIGKRKGRWQTSSLKRTPDRLTAGGRRPRCAVLIPCVRMSNISRVSHILSGIRWTHVTFFTLESPPRPRLKRNLPGQDLHTGHRGPSVPFRPVPIPRKGTVMRNDLMHHLKSSGNSQTTLDIVSK